MNITHDTTFPPQLANYIQELENQPFEAPLNNIYASELDGCIRKSWYRRQYNRPPSKETAIYLRNGTWRHEAFQQAYTTKEQRYSIPFRIGACIVGRADAINDKGELLEFKNVKNPYFLKKNQEPHEWDRNRILFYMWLGGYTTGHLYYFHGEIDKPEHFTFTITDEDIPSMLDLEKRYKELALALHEALLLDSPPQPLNKRDFDCNYCEYRDECVKQNNMGEDTKA